MTIRLDAHLPEFHRGAPPQLPVRCATTASVTIATALNAGDAIDGITLAAGDRVLVKSQSTGSQNGVYIAGATPARAYDMAEGVAAWGAVIYVIAGTANGGKTFANTNTTLPTIDTTALTFADYTPGGSSTLTVSDEGTPLATAATTLDFVGAGVVASGAGATKTITISGGGGGGTAPVFVGAKVYNSAVQATSNGVTTGLTWDTEDFDSNGFHSTSSNTDRLTIPASLGGTYLVVLSVGWGSNTTGDRQIQVKKNGSTLVAARVSSAANLALAAMELAAILELGVGDYITAEVSQSSGGSLNVASSVTESSFSIAQLAVGTGAALTVAIPFLIDGGGATITTGIKGDLSIPFACTVTGWRILADQSGSIVMDTWKDTYANYPPVVGDAIWGGSKPTVSSATKAEATGLSIAVTAGDTLRFNVDSVTSIQRVTLTLTATRT